MAMTLDNAIDIAKHPDDYFPSEVEEMKEFAVSLLANCKKIEHIESKNAASVKSFYEIREVERDAS
jgi:hypothetical protein